MAIGLGDAVLNITGNSAGLGSALNKAQFLVVRSFQSMAGSAIILSGAFSGLGISLTRGLRGAIRETAEFEEAVTSMAAKTVEAGDDFSVVEGELRDLTLTLNNMSKFTAQEVASALENLTKAGVKPLNEEVEDLVQIFRLAEATGASLEVSQKAIVTTMRQFNLQFSDASHIADVFTFAANNSRATVDGLVEAMKFAGPVFASVGTPLEEAVALIAALNDRALQAGLSGRGLARSIFSLVAPAQEAEERLNRAGIQMDEFDQSVFSLVDSIDSLRAQGADVTDIMKNFPAQAARVILALLDVKGAGAATTQSVRDFVARMKDAKGIAQETAENQLSGLAGVLKILESRWTSLKTKMITAANDGFKAVANFISGELLVPLFELVKVVPEIGKLFVLLTAVIGGVATALATVFAGIAIFTLIGTGLINLFLTPLGLILSALAIILVSVFGAALATVVRKIRELKDQDITQIFGKETIQKIKDGLAKVIDIVLAGLIIMVKFFEALAIRIARMLGFSEDKVREFFEGSLTDIFLRATDKIADWFEENMDEIVEFGNRVITFVANSVVVIIRVLAFLWAAIKFAWNNILSPMFKFVNEEVRKLKDGSEGLESIWGRLKDIWDDVKSVLEPIWEFYKKMVGVESEDDWRAFKEHFTVIEFVLYLIDQTLNGIQLTGEAIGEAFAWIAEKTQEAHDWLHKMAELSFEKLTDMIKSFGRLFGLPILKGVDLLLPGTPAQDAARAGGFLDSRSGGVSLTVNGGLNIAKEADADKVMDIIETRLVRMQRRRGLAGA